MLREIHEQPAAIERTLQHYVEGNQFRESSFGSSADCFRKHKDIVIAASGSSRHAGLAAEIMLEDAAGLSVDVEYASEYICRTTNTKRDPAVLVISQSGETGDTLAALREAIFRGHPTLAVTNVQNSSMMQEASIALPTLAGVELAIPATKSFTTQLVVLRLLSLYAAQSRDVLAPEELTKQLAQLAALPALIARQLDGWQKRLSELADIYHDAKTLLFLGRGIHYAIAREGALKLKESSYIHAEGYPTGELKHGPNALVSDEVPLVILATVDRSDADANTRRQNHRHLQHRRRSRSSAGLSRRRGRRGERIFATHLRSRPATALRLLHGSPQRCRRRPPPQSRKIRRPRIAHTHLQSMMVTNPHMRCPSLALR